MTTSLRNPANQNQRIGAAFGLGHAHEFTHAFGRLADEYMETTTCTGAAISETSNVAGSNQCDSLPWAHLLEGRGINTTAGLVGAFGVAGARLPLGAQLPDERHARQRPVLVREGDERYTTLTLRPERFCNFCREIIAFRVFERSGDPVRHERICDVEERLPRQVLRALRLRGTRRRDSADPHLQPQRCTQARVRGLRPVARRARPSPLQRARLLYTARHSMRADRTMCLRALYAIALASAVILSAGTSAARAQYLPRDNPYVYGLRIALFPAIFQGGVSQSHFGSALRAELDLSRRFVFAVAGRLPWVAVGGDLEPLGYSVRAGFAFNFVDEIQSEKLFGTVHPADTPALGERSGVEFKGASVSDKLGSPPFEPPDRDLEVSAPIRNVQAIRLGYDLVRGIEQGRPDLPDYVSTMHAFYAGYAYSLHWNLSPATAGEREVGWRRYYFDLIVTAPADRRRTARRERCHADARPRDPPGRFADRDGGGDRCGAAERARPRLRLRHRARPLTRRERLRRLSVHRTRPRDRCRGPLTCR